MQENDNKTDDERTIGPFTEADVRAVAEKAVLGMGRNWDELTSRQKNGFVNETAHILSSKPLTTQFSELVPGATPAVELQYRNLVLQEFRNSPKWDEKEFKGKFASPAAIVDDDAATTGAGTQPPE